MSSPSLTHLLPSSSMTTKRPSRLLTPITNAIPLLPTELAQRYSIAHTLLVPAYYYLRSSALVRDPFNTLVLDAGVIAILQCTFCATCLPQAGKWDSGTEVRPSSPATPKGKTGKSTGSTGSVRKKNVGATLGGAASGGKSVKGSEVPLHGRILVRKPIQ
jgi:hypothetical protein